MPNWLEKILSKAKQAKAKISDAFKKIPLQNAELWKSCPECKKMFLGKQLIQNLYVLSSHVQILCFTTKGKVFWLKVYEIPVA